jgi:hypothetical protein
MGDVTVTHITISYRLRSYTSSSATIPKHNDRARSKLDFSFSSNLDPVNFHLQPTKAALLITFQSNAIPGKPESKVLI